MPLCVNQGTAYITHDYVTAQTEREKGTRQAWNKRIQYRIKAQTEFQTKKIDPKVAQVDS